MGLRGVRAVLFDWGDTLVRYPGFSTDGGGHLAAVGEVFDWLASGPERECLAIGPAEREAFVAAYRAASEVQFAAMARTGVDEPMGRRLVEALAVRGCRCPTQATDERGVAREVRYLERLFDALAGRTAPMEDAAAVLSSLRARFAVGVVSNFPEGGFVRRTLELHGLQRLTDVIVVSAEVGRMKPHRAPFDAAFGALGVEPAQVLFVGDDLNSDIRGAAELGCHTAWLPRQVDERRAAPAGTHRIGALADLLSLLAEGR